MTPTGSAGSTESSGVRQMLAAAVGSGNRTWRAYLSTQGQGAVNAKDRIGPGPWQNAKGVVVAKDVADLHGASNNLTKQTSLNEKGEVINGRGDTPNRHDALTGSQADGTAFAAGVLAPAGATPAAGRPASGGGAPWWSGKRRGADEESEAA